MKRGAAWLLIFLLAAFPAGSGLCAEDGPRFVVSNQLNSHDVEGFVKGLYERSGAAGVEVLGVHQEDNHADIYVKYKKKNAKTGKESEVHETVSVVRFNSRNWFHPDSHSFLTK